MSSKLLKRAIQNVEAEPAGNTSSNSKGSKNSGSSKQGPSKLSLKRQAQKTKKKQELERAALQSAQLTQQRNLQYFSSKASSASTDCMTQVFKKARKGKK